MTFTEFGARRLGKTFMNLAAIAHMSGYISRAKRLGKSKRATSRAAKKRVYKRCDLRN